MAEIVLCPLLQVIFEKVTSIIMKEIGFRRGFKEEINKLGHTLMIIQAVLEDAEERQVKEKALKIWLAELKEVAYDADNLMDEFCSKAGLVKSQTNFMSQVTDIIPPFIKPFSGSLAFFPKLKEIRSRLDILAVQRVNFNLREGFVKRECDVEGRRQTGSFVIESEVFGREEDKQEIIELLLSNGEGVSVISIVGLGGLGKTTLAQLVYNDERLKTSFELKIWVCVNQEFNVRKIMKLIIESVTKHKCDLLGMDVLQSQLRYLLHGKRFLLVLDDVWNEDHDEWDKLRISLSDCAKGSRVIITTRDTKVALIVGTVPPYCLKGLSRDDCWELFKQRAFACGESHPNLLSIGREMVNKCGGIPLAAKALGSLMRLKREEGEWLDILESDLWNACEGESGILPALRLSYSNLPSRLKCCFTYCSVFPKNYAIKKDDLVQLWIAEGLIKSNGRQSLEETGNYFFKKLMWMFFFQNVSKDSNGSATEYKMHDLVHDLAQSTAGDEFIVLEHSHLPRHLAQTRHSSVVCDSKLHSIPESLYEAKKLRTLNLLFPRGNLGEVPPNLFSSFRYLRSLNLSGSGIKGLHCSISCLISLRYLNLSNTLIKTLPESIWKLYYLQVLNVAYCYNLIELPKRLVELLNLRHLMIKGCDKLSRLPDLIGRLVQLQTLPTFMVGTGYSQGLNQLQGLPLVGELNITQLENANSRFESRMAILKMKPKLCSLGLSWRLDHDDLISRNNDDSRLAEELLELLQPHQNLKRLSIEGYPGKCFPRWIGIPELPNLTDIVLIYCKRCEHLPALGQLPFLKTIYLLGMPNVKNIGSEFYGGVSERQFQSLQELSFIDFPNLEFWWSMNRKEEFPSLVKLTINKCPKLKNMPYLPSLEHLELRNCCEMILRSAANLSTLLNLVIDVFTGRLVFLESLLGNNPHLMSLTISSCTNLCSISSKLGGLTALKSLTIRWCEELLSLPQEIQNLSSLESLEIVECHSLTNLPEGVGGLSSLRSLSIENCNKITSLPMGLQHLTALEHLTLMYCPSLAFLPANFRNLSMLKSLYILNCPQLECLPEELQHVTTLQNLELHSCPAIKNLPAWIGSLSSLSSLSMSDCCNIISLPEGLRHLIILQHLSIRECPRLEHRCKKYTGEDWPKVAHIPHIYIGSIEPRQGDSASSSSR